MDSTINLDGDSLVVSQMIYSSDPVSEVSSCVYYALLVLSYRMAKYGLALAHFQMTQCGSRDFLFRPTV